MSSPNQANTLLGILAARLRETARSYAPGAEEPPVCVLWTDPEGDWRPLIPILKAILPELLELGDYAPDERRGPVIWLKTALGGLVPGYDISPGQSPILYLPGVSRHQLRQADQCPRELQPLVELLYRGEAWTHKNGRDWTVEAFFVAPDGLALDLSQDKRTRLSLHSALQTIAQVPLDKLKGRRLEASDLDSLVAGDTPRDLLTWIGQGEAVKAEWNAEHWHAFRSRCRDDYAFDPEKESPLSAAEKLGLQEEKPWKELWNRFREAPAHYRGVRDRLEQAKPVDLLALDGEPWPSINLSREDELRNGLFSLENLTAGDARQKLARLESEHASRRKWVWAELAEAPLALALEHLSLLAEKTQTNPSCATLQDLADWYASSGWKADWEVLHALREVSKPDDRKAVSTAIRALYLPWLEDLALRFQELAGISYTPSPEITVAEGECLLFVDGLRMDLGHLLMQKLDEAGYDPGFSSRLAALPSVTSTAKPAVSPIAQRLHGNTVPADFRPNNKAGDELTHQRFLKELKLEGVEKIDASDPICPGPDAKGWCETGRIDSRGHNLQAELAGVAESELEQTMDLVEKLFAAGWQKLRIITDHGWLLVPGGLPKHHLPGHLVESRWSRCAAIKDGNKPDIPTYPWHWNPNEYFASPPGATVFKAGDEYSHGGISPQECVIPVLSLLSPSPSGASNSTPRIGTIKWNRQRCRISVDNSIPGLTVDLRTSALAPDSSLCAKAKEVEEDGEASLLVADEELAGTKAFLVLLSLENEIISQQPTTIGG